MNSVVISDPEILGGAPVFKGTRVLARTLTDYLLAGETIDAFLRDFPSVQPDQARAFLQEADAALSAAAR